MPPPYTTDVSLFLCRWSFIVCFAQGTCSKFATSISRSWSSPPETSFLLPETKSVQPTASSETVDIFDAYLVRMFAFVCRNLAPAEFLVRCSPAAFQARLAPLVPNWTPKLQLEPFQPPARSNYHTFLFAARSIGWHHGPRKVSIRQEQGSVCLNNAAVWGVGSV